MPFGAMRKFQRGKKMVLSERGDNIDEISEEMYDVFTTPATQASKFYTLYYVVEELNTSQFDFDLFQTTNEQKDAFYNYSVYVCAREMTNIYTHFAIDNIKLDGIHRVHPDLEAQAGAAPTADTSENKAKLVVEEIEEQIDNNAPRDIRRKAKQIMLRNPRNAGGALALDELKTLNKGAEEQWSVFSDSDKFLRACKFIFSHDWGEKYRDSKPPYIYIDPEDNENAFGWQVQYGGDAWGSVAKTALLRNSLGGEAYVDMMWSVEHNNGNFIDKMPDIKSIDIESVTDALNEEREENDELSHKYKSGYTKKMVAYHLLDRIIPSILDAARSGNIRPVYRIMQNRFEILGRDVRETMLPQKRPLGIIAEEKGGLEAPGVY
jgi:hypothetical protein